MKRIYILLIAIVMALNCVNIAYADTAWPSDTGIEAEGGILIDADTGAVLYGQNIHVKYYPASITKILTALVIIENCGMDEEVTFSHNAVYNVESGSTSAGYDEGDTLTVRDALYAMLLKSANEVANALAEHCAGSVEAFADMMNEKAESLGCTESHFANPSGLNDENHYTTAYDYALIARAAFANETFVSIDETTYYELPPSKNNPDGQTVYCGHKMLKKNSSYYYPGIVGGKTGYTMLAGNTLVTCAQRDDMRLITVILNGHQTHYTDTKALLDFGFSRYKHMPLANYIGKYTLPQENLSFGPYVSEDASALYVDDAQKAVTIPTDSDGSELTTEITYDMPEEHPKRAIAQLVAKYDGREVGSCYLMMNENRVADIETTVVVPEGEETEETEGMKPIDIDTLIPLQVRIAIIVIAVLAAVVASILGVRYIIKKHEEKDLLIFREKRKQRRIELGIQDTDVSKDISTDTSASVGSYTKGTSHRKKGWLSGLFHKKL